MNLVVHGCVDTALPKPIWVLTEAGNYTEYWLLNENDDSLTHKTGDVYEVVFTPDFYFVNLPKEGYDAARAAAEKRLVFTNINRQRLRPPKKA